MFIGKPRYYNTINNDLKILLMWMNNVAKTHSMLLSTKHKRKILMNQNESMVLKIRDNEVEEVQNIKYLGVYPECLAYRLTTLLTGKSKLKQYPLKSPELLDF